MANEHKDPFRITINLSKNDIEFLDKIVNEKIFLSRTDCLRSLLREYKVKYEYEKEKQTIRSC